MKNADEVRAYYERIAEACITPEIETRHQHLLERLQAKLFRRRQPADYSIVPGTTKTVRPIVSNLIGAEPTLGGIKFETDSRDPSRRIEVEIHHWARMVFTVFLMVYEGGALPHVRFAVQTEFREL